MLESLLLLRRTLLLRLWLVLDLEDNLRRLEARILRAALHVGLVGHVVAEVIVDVGLLNLDLLALAGGILVPGAAV